jgi:hypothetical protein
VVALSRHVLRQLLTHTAGLPEVVYPSWIIQPVFGEMTKLGRPVPSLAEYYRGALGQVAEPAPGTPTPTIGSPHSATFVEDVIGQPLARHLLHAKGHGSLRGECLIKRRLSISYRRTFKVDHGLEYAVERPDKHPATADHRHGRGGVGPHRGSACRPRPSARRPGTRT